MILIKTTETGVEEWTQTFESVTGADDAGFAVKETEGGCYLLLGSTSRSLYRVCSF